MIAVTGASGAVGGRVARLLAGRGEPLRLCVRDADRAPELKGAEVRGGADYADGEAMRRALEGAQTVFMVSAVEVPDRVEQHRTAVDAAMAAGVERIVYLSHLAAAPDAVFTFGRDHFHTEEDVKGSGLRWTFLRDSLYLDFVPTMVGDDGVIRGPAGQGRVAAVARDDIAAAALAVLTGDGHDGETYALTGPEAFTLTEAAEQVSRFAGRPCTYIEETLEEARASRAPSGAPDWEIEGWVSSYTSIAAGEMNVASGDVQRLTGARPRTLERFLSENPASYRQLVPA